MKKSHDYFYINGHSATFKAYLILFFYTYGIVSLGGLTSAVKRLTRNTLNEWKYQNMIGKTKKLTQKASANAPNTARTVFIFVNFSTTDGNWSFEHAIYTQLINRIIRLFAQYVSDFVRRSQTRFVSKVTTSCGIKGDKMVRLRLRNWFNMKNVYLFRPLF